MKYDYTVTQDGIVYNAGEEVPDMGSITAIVSNGNYREYNALSKDYDKLPHYVSFGSSCYMIDVSELYKYDAINQIYITPSLKICIESETRKMAECLE